LIMRVEMRGRGKGGGRRGRIIPYLESGEVDNACLECMPIRRHDNDSIVVRYGETTQLGYLTDWFAHFTDARKTNAVSLKGTRFTWGVQSGSDMNADENLRRDRESDSTVISYPNSS
jgi:hypothetical protein